MFSKKSTKHQSTSKLLHLLNKRSSLKRTPFKRGVYEQWPSSQKPSLFNCSTNYIKYLSSCNSHKKDAEPESNKKKKSFLYAKQSATFSTCTTMEFFTPTQQNIHFHSKFSTTPQSQQLNQDHQTLKKDKFTPYMTLLQDNCQILDQSDSHLKNLNDEDYEKQLNSKYGSRPKTVNNHKKGQAQQRRLINTAKIHRQNLQNQIMNEELTLANKKSIGREIASSNTNSINIKNQNFVKDCWMKRSGMKSPTILSNFSKENIMNSFNYPMRLKDYETNFQAYKLISDLIDQQMKWEPKKARPKSSVFFRNYSIGAKA